MADGLITQTIPNLIGGISQQTPSLRRADQCEDQVNCRNDPVTGMGKRYNTEWLADLVGLDNPEEYVIEHINRDDLEKYIFAIKDGDLKVFDKKTGFPYTILIPSWASNYLTRRGDKTPEQTFQLLNAVDTTFLLNKTAPVKYLQAPQVTEIPPPEEARRYVVEVSRHPQPYKDSWQEFAIEMTVNGNKYRYDDARASAATLASWARANIDAEYPTASSVVVVDNIITVDFAGNETLELTGAHLFGTNIRGRPFTITESAITITYPSPETPSALWYVKQADYSTKYTLDLEGEVFTIDTPEATSANARSGLETGSMAEDMRLLIDGSVNFTAVRYGSVLYISRVDGEDFTIKHYDDLANTGSYAIKGQVEDFEELPPTAPLGYRIEVAGGFNVDVDPYHLVYTELDEDGNATVGYWKETLKLGLAYRLDNQTMPLSITRRQSDTYITTDNPNGIYFDLTETEWAERTVGDDITAPFPSFCSTIDADGFVTKQRHILSMGYYRNRLYFTSEENIVFSEASEYLNFFPKTVLAVLDGSVIDLNIPTTGTDTVEWTLSSAGGLFMFTKNDQVRLSGGEVFNIDSINMEVISSYQMDTNVKPFTDGPFVYFWTKDSISSQLMEYSRDGDTEKWTASQVTAHVPNLVRGQVVRTVNTVSNRTYITLARDTTGALLNRVYIYNYLWSEGTKAQNAWQYWEFEGEVIDVSTEDDIAYFLIKCPDDRITLELMYLSHDPINDELGHPVRLDSRQEVTSDYTLPEGDTRVLEVYEDRYFIGYKYQQKYVFSEFYPRASDGKARKGGRLQVRYLYLDYSDTTLFDVTVDREGRVAKVIKFTGRNVGSLNNLIGLIPVETGQLQVRIQSRSSGATVTITNDSPFDAVFQTAEVEGTYVNRARRA